MITLTIDSHLVQTLIDIIKVHIDDLQVEIRHTSNSAYKEMFKCQRAPLEELLEQLNQSHPSNRINIAPQTAEILIHIIDNNVDDLRVEIRHTDNIYYKEMLKQKRDMIKGLRVQFSQSQPLMRQLCP